jgi:hypothetical protein
MYGEGYAGSSIQGISRIEHPPAIGPPVRPFFWPSARIVDEDVEAASYLARMRQRLPDRMLGGDLEQNRRHAPGILID